MNQPMDFKDTKSCLFFGAINGIIFTIAYQPVKIAYIKYLWYIKNDNYVYVELPEIYRISRDAGDLLVWILLFTLASYTVQRFWGNKVNTITLWLRIAMTAFAVPIAGLWIVRIIMFGIVIVLKQFSDCDFPACSESVWSLSSMLIREWINIRFEIVLVSTGIIINSIYGLLLTKLQKFFSK
jgi:hypothetical protein